jgi:aminoglycoside phosphotransferase (APT) family kinase protein
MVFEMRMLASGRDADVFAYGDDLILRRYRDGRPAGREADTIRAVAALGYPVPDIRGGTGPDIIMQRINGPTLAEAARSGHDPERAGAALADLHDRLHALEWPSTTQGESLLHLDLHPQNVIVSGSGLFVVDWTNARPGPPGLDVALTALILAQVVVTDGMLAAAGFSEEGRPKVAVMLGAFAAHVCTPYVDLLLDAETFRRQDRYQSAAELGALPQAVDLAREVAR